jgi:tetratricopeptide (TPR) repeat protein
MTLQGNHVEATAVLEESLALYRSLRDRRGIAGCLSGLGRISAALQDSDTAGARFEEALLLFRELNDMERSAGVLANLAFVARLRGDTANALILNEESLLIYRQVGNVMGASIALSQLGMVAIDREHTDDARNFFRESLEIRHDLQDSVRLAESLEEMASASEPLHAARLWGAAERNREDIGAPLDPHDEAWYNRQFARARATLTDESEFERAWQEGRGLTLSQAIELALQADL